MITPLCGLVGKEKLPKRDLSIGGLLDFKCIGGVGFEFSINVSPYSRDG